MRTVLSAPCSSLHTVGKAAAEQMKTLEEGGREECRKEGSWGICVGGPGVRWH